jgi:alkaline phosphatase
MNKKILLFILGTTWLLNISFNVGDKVITDTSNIRPVKNIILLIGDGMGLAQIYAGYTENKGSLNILNFPYTGICKTNSADRYVTDSAAGATAMATGKKTKNGMLAMDSLGRSFVTILEIAEKYGRSTGLVATASITDATPAAFIAHCSSRFNNEDIALDFLKNDIDVFIGGGRNYFNKRTDNRDLTVDLRKKGYKVAFTLDDIAQTNTGKLAGLTSELHNPFISEGRGNMLSVSTETAIRLLSRNSKGFFLMVEGSHIDMAGHKNNLNMVAQEVIDFDKVVAIAHEFASKDSNTLVIITADHETDGLVLTGGNLKQGTVEGKFANNYHTAVPVMVFAYGPGAEKFTGFYDNTEIFKKMMNAYGFTESKTAK